MNENYTKLKFQMEWVDMDRLQMIRDNSLLDLLNKFA